MKKLTIYLAFTISLLFITTIVNAQIIYTDINPDVTISTATSYDLNLDNDPAKDFKITGSNPIMAPRRVTMESMSADAEVLYGPNYSYPSAFTSGQDVDSLQTQWGVAATATVLNTGGATGHWPGCKNHYLGLRIKIKGVWHYGWARMDIPLDASSFTIKDYAYESTPGKSIKTGDMGAVNIKDNSSTNNISVYAYNKTLFINLNNPDIKAGTIKLYNITGQLVKTYAIDNSHLEIDIEDIHTGIYLLTIHHAAGTFSKKISIR